MVDGWTVTVLDLLTYAGRRSHLDGVDVDLAPDGVGSARRPALTDAVLVDALGLRVDPAEAQRLAHGRCPGEALGLDVFLVQSHPELGGGFMVLNEPGAKVFWVLEEDCRTLGAAA